MSDDDALRAAIVAAPDADLPRLVYADFIQEAGDEAGAEFVRAQVELAATPEYEPFAVRLHAHFPHLVAGEFRRPTLPSIAGLDWVPGRLFRRGFGWAVGAPFLPSLQRGMPALRAREPVQSLALGTSIPEQWEELAAAPWLPSIRELRFTGLQTPLAPIRILCATPAAGGLRALHFERGDSPSMYLLLQAVFAAPMGQGLTALSLRHSTDQSGELVESMAAAPALDELSLVGISVPWAAAVALVGCGLLARLRVLRLSDCYLTAGSLQDLADSPLAGRLEVLEVPRAHLRDSAADVLAGSPHLTGLRKLNLSDNTLDGRGVRALAQSESLGGLRSLLLKRTGADNDAVGRLTRAAFWPNLVELDLTYNPLDDRAADHLLSAATPPDLTDLRLSVNRFSEPVREDLVRKYGPAVRFVPDE